MASLDDVPFDLDGTESDSQDEIEFIFGIYGFDSWRDVFVNWEDQDPTTWRTVRFETPEEALIFAQQRRILPFTKLVYYVGNPLPYGWVVGTSP